MTTAQTRSSISELQLIDWCRTQRSGWESAVVQWLDGSSGWLHRRCAARLGCASIADDAVQEISIKVMQAIGRFEGRSTLRTWVIRIADNHCNEVIRQQCANVISDHLKYSMTQIELNRYSSDKDIERRSNTSKRVGETLQCMTRKNQEVLQLRFYSDQSLDEMASSLSMSLSATKMRLYRAMDAFKLIYTRQASPIVTK